MFALFLITFGHPLSFKIIMNNSGVGFPGSTVIKILPAISGDVDLTPGSGRVPGEGNGSPLHYSCLKIS